MSAAATLPAWFWMWSLAVAIFGVCKLASWSTCSVAAPAWKHAAYLLAWPGMDCDAFLRPHEAQTRQVALSEWLFASFKFALGLLLLWSVASVFTDQRIIIQAWAGMVGIVFVLHFGLFHLLSCAWLSAGIAAVPVMNWPMLSANVSEFWGRRWNLAFRDLTHRFLFVPCKRILGPAGALFIGFVVSGLVHDLVISWPSGGGWGLPTLYFVVQGVGLLFERSGCGQACGLGNGWQGRLFCVAVVVLPSPLLFHTAFLRNVMAPFVSAVGVIA